MRQRDPSSVLTIADLQKRLADAAQERFPGAVVRGVAPMEGGASSLTFRAEVIFEGRARSLVVKVAPPGREPIGHRDVLRQARVLTTLAGEGHVPVPVVIFSDHGDPPSVPPLFAMNLIPGDSTEPLFGAASSDADSAEASLRAADVVVRAHHAATLLGALQQTDLGAAVFLGEPVWTPSDEVQRWSAALATIDRGLVDEWPRCRDALLAAVPAAAPPVLCHGDYRLGNMLAISGRIEAIIDWELWAIGDPRFDLAWLRLNADPGVYGRASRVGVSMPSADALLASYLRSVGQSVAALDWFDALARFKAAATWSLILKHARTDGAHRFEFVRHVAPSLVREALRRLQ